MLSRIIKMRCSGRPVVIHFKERSASVRTDVKPSELFSSTAREQFLIALHLCLLRSQYLPQWRAASL